MYICAKILSDPSLQSTRLSMSNWFTLCNLSVIWRYQRAKDTRIQFSQSSSFKPRMNEWCMWQANPKIVLLGFDLGFRLIKKWRLLWAAQLNNYFLHVHFSQWAIKPHCKLQQTQSTYPTYTVNIFGARAFEVETKTIWENHLFTCQKVHILAILYSSSLDKSSDLIMSEARRTNNVKEMRKRNQRLRL